MSSSSVNILGVGFVLNYCNLYDERTPGHNLLLIVHHINNLLCEFGRHVTVMILENNLVLYSSMYS